MSLKLEIALGAFVVLVACMMTMISNYPRLVSPYSFSVVLPAFFFSSLKAKNFNLYILAALPTVIFYLIWSTFFINKSLRISKPTAILSLVFIVLSVVFNAANFKYGIKFQGIPHTVLIYTFNLILVATMAFVYKINMSKPNLANCLGFNILLFSWVGWVAFPWLGELI